MKIQADRTTDLGTFLYEISNCLEKEGSALQCLARTWYEPGDPEHTTVRQFGIDISDLGEQLMALKKQLCTACLTKEVMTAISFKGSQEPKSTEKDQQPKQ
ncbi:MAG: hypothetical protein ACE5GM_10000 [bacterium]